MKDLPPRRTYNFYRIRLSIEFYVSMRSSIEFCLLTSNYSRIGNLVLYMSMRVSSWVSIIVYIVIYSWC
ncbi:hypothetical protein RHMOL_Rhmol10G0206000 [Rhododendron molle]|uniref:Uncharacterized protein n=1 Tax=Rhododendron molle TaxID=49168 RepID=A0ACC0M496_RHOML|nr:hypothetical protein RHMOL_Rhmol10G0206000 [Rhododendron molle]